jgi:hypothetical protein
MYIFTNKLESYPQIIRQYWYFSKTNTKSVLKSNLDLNSFSNENIKCRIFRIKVKDFIRNTLRCDLSCLIFYHPNRMLAAWAWEKTSFKKYSKSWKFWFLCILLSFADHLNYFSWWNIFLEQISTFSLRMPNCFALLGKVSFSQGTP